MDIENLKAQLTPRLRQLREHVSEGWQRTSQRPEGDLALGAVKIADLGKALSPELKSLAEEFNSILDEINPPSEFAQVSKGVVHIAKAMRERMGYQLPPTLQQYFARVEKTYPKLQQVGEAMKDAHEESYRRQAMAMDEVDKIQVFLTKITAERSDLLMLRESIAANAGEKSEITDRLNNEILLPIDSQLQAYSEMIKFHKTDLNHKLAIILKADEIIEQSQRTLSITLPAIRSAITTLSDIDQLRAVQDASDRTRNVATAAIEMTSQAIAGLYENTDRLRGETTLSMQVFETVNTRLAKTIRDSEARQLGIFQAVQKSLQRMNEDEGALNKYLAANRNRILAIENRVRNK